MADQDEVTTGSNAEPYRHRSASDEQFERDVFPAELSDVCKRRRQLNEWREEKSDFAVLPCDKIQQALDDLKDCRGPRTRGDKEEADAKQKEHQPENRDSKLRQSFRRHSETFTRWVSDGYVETFQIRKVRKEEGQIRPNAELGLIGLALSGGGIRSACFNLGLLQGLHHHEILREVDYLSTVSGGGYIGSALSSALSEPGKNMDRDFDLGLARGDRESGALQHLRSFSSFLTPKGLLDQLLIPILVLRGIVLNLLMVVPLVALLAWLTALAAEMMDSRIPWPLDVKSERLSKKLSK